jgi:hypothetical protein
MKSFAHVCRPLKPPLGVSLRRGGSALLWVLVVFLAAATLTATVGLAGCGGGSGGSVDAKTVLAQASVNMKKIQGFHFVYTVQKPKQATPGTGLEIDRIVGDVDAQGGMMATIDVTQSSIPLQLKFVAIGDTQYIQNPLSQAWQKVAVADSPVGKLNLNAGTIQILDKIVDPTYVADESIGGTATHHVKGTVSAAEVAAVAGAVSVTGTFPTDIWVGAKDGLVYQVQIAGAATTTEDPKTVRVITLSNLNKPVDIKAPI